MPSPFTKDQDLNLIKFVKKSPILYNNNHDKFLDSEQRENAWKRISDALEKPAIACKNRWINIRDNMRRKIREREKFSNQPWRKNQSKYKYKYEDELAFLIPFFRNINVEGGCSEEADDYADNENSGVESEKVFFDNDYSTEDVLDVKPNVSNFVLVNKRQDEFINNASFDNVSTSQERPLDPVAVFLEAIGSTLRELNPFYLNQAKTRIFQVVQDCELQQIVNKGEQPPIN
ncbi:uncharacterized protein LOC126372503 [Pectinophora gossypiella]|uniref:uncharacterized protein LOC126372503 n=1 Tax=Pectinophora gossypiella TaxID=13191 RepID=UPI00214F5DDC|nr:uncharacterized protein LOC126372503 [Pectinophora gossypiella]